MSDPRLNGSHLSVARRDQYDAMVDELLNDRGPATSEADPLPRLPSNRCELMRRESTCSGGTYTLINIADGRRHPLRVGINTIGRYPKNDLVLVPNFISRRHCVVLVHSTGGCEVYDTASRHGIRVNRHRVAHFDLLPGDVLTLCDQDFLVAWTDTDGEMFQSGDAAETIRVAGLTRT